MTRLLRNLAPMSLRLLPMLYSQGGECAATLKPGTLLSALSIAAKHLSEVQTFGSRPITLSRPLLAVAATQPDLEAEIKLTDSAIQRLHELTADTGSNSSFLRVTVEAGGCSGFSYKFSIENSLQEGDRVYEASGARLAVDQMSLEFLRGAKIDYTQELIKSAFEVVENPNADKGCGCGTSFAPK